MLEDLMSVYGQEVWDFAFALTGSLERADAVSQQVFVEAGRKRQWKVDLLREAMGLARAGRKKTLPAADDVDEAWRDVLELPPKQRAAVVLFARCKLEVPEIADVLGVRESEVVRLLQKAGDHNLTGSPVRGSGFSERNRTHVRKALRHAKTPAPPRLLPWVLGFLFVVLAAMLLMRLNADVVK